MKTFFGLLGYIALMLVLSYEIFKDDIVFTDNGNVKQIEINGESLYERPVLHIDDPEVYCLAENIFHEARNQSVDGMAAVAYVTLNRVKHIDYPDTICEVVHEPYQFSWVHEQKTIQLDNAIDEQAWKTSQEIALIILEDGVPYDMLGVYHYHADYVEPKWSYAKIEHSRIDNHIFYKKDI
jgi:spore germination cell wall hydrolase CwlJ-like protein